MCTSEIAQFNIQPERVDNGQLPGVLLAERIYTKIGLCNGEVHFQLSVLSGFLSMFHIEYLGHCDHCSCQNQLPEDQSVTSALVQELIAFALHRQTIEELDAIKLFMDDINRRWAAGGIIG